MEYRCCKELRTKRRKPHSWGRDVRHIQMSSRRNCGPRTRSWQAGIVPRAGSVRCLIVGLCDGGRKMGLDAEGRQALLVTNPLPIELSFVSLRKMVTKSDGLGFCSYRINLLQNHTSTEICSWYSHPLGKKYQQDEQNRKFRCYSWSTYGICAHPSTFMQSHSTITPISQFLPYLWPLTPSHFLIVCRISCLVKFHLIIFCEHIFYLFLYSIYHCIQFISPTMLFLFTFLCVLWFSQMNG